MSATGVQVTLAERSDGVHWTLARIPVIEDASGTALTGVSCSARDACTAVGSYTTPAGTQVGLIESWNGAQWDIESAGEPVMSAVSCTSGRACMAVGRSSAETWAGNRWTVRALPAPTGSQSVQLNGISCTRATACTAVGSHQGSLVATSTLAERWDGTSWTIQSTPNGPEPTSLHAVSCSPPSTCMAVGQWSDEHDNDVAAELWDGTSWSLFPLQSVPIGDAGYGAVAFNGVSCPTPDACEAVGALVVNQNSLLAAHWDGTNWTIETTPSPDNTQAADQFNSVSCPAPAVCAAVGSSAFQTAQLIEEES